MTQVRNGEECAMKEKNRKERGKKKENNGKEGQGGKERDLKDMRRRRKNSRTQKPKHKN